MIYILVLIILFTEIIHDATMEKACVCDCDFYKMRNIKLLKGFAILLALTVLILLGQSRVAITYFVARLFLFDPLLYKLAGRGLPLTLWKKIIYIITHSEIYYWITIIRRKV